MSENNQPNGKADVFWEHLSAGRLPAEADFAIHSYAKSALNPVPVHIRDTVGLSPIELARVRHHIQSCKNIMESRNKLIDEPEADAQFILPKNNWAIIDRPDYLPSIFIRGGDDILSRMRLIAAHFSGFSLVTMGTSHNFTMDTFNNIDTREYSDWLDLCFNDHCWVKLWKALMTVTQVNHVFKPPAILGEIGWRIDDVIVNPDTVCYQERITMLSQAGVLGSLEKSVARGEKPYMIEIGSGYGAIALALQQIIPGLHYIAIDLPESLLFCSTYLAVALPDAQISIIEHPEDIRESLMNDNITLVPHMFLPHLLEVCPPISFAINTLSMGEMAEYQVDTYARALAQVLGMRGIFFEQNQDNRTVQAPGIYPDVPSIIARHFSTRLRLQPKGQFMYQGEPNIWANFSF